MSASERNPCNLDRHAPTGEADAHVLGQLFIAQSTLEVIPTEQGLYDFLIKAVGIVPGVAKAQIYPAGSAPGAAGDEPAPPGGDRAWLPLNTSGHLYGIMVLDLTDPKAFPAYEPYLRNLVNTAAVLLENRSFVNLLKDANDQLLHARDDLEQRVKERTWELSEANARLQKEVAERRRTEDQLAELSRYDPLTGLPNRVLLRDILGQAIARARRSQAGLAVLFLDLDLFKHVNDAFGHAAGDALLTMVAHRLQSAMREGDTLSRFGGDEFSLILEAVKDESDVEVLAKQLLSSFDEPFNVGEREIFVSTSIGIAMLGTHEDVDAMLRNADLAMYHAKQEGRAHYQFYTPDMKRRTTERMTMETKLRRALERREFFLLYQPQVDLTSGQVIGVEALLRWQNEELGLIQPTQFIPIAEETGLIFPLEEWVLDTACTQNKAWQSTRMAPLRVAVNVSSGQLKRKNLAETVRRVLDKTGLPANLLDLEFTESIILQNVSETVALLHELSELGVEISIDDFGTGYSSLSYLKRFPIHKLKIDQSFVRDIANSPEDAAIVRAIVMMAHSLKLKVVAEGVETAEQLAFLQKQLGEHYQGFLFSPPISAEEITRLLNAPPA